MKEVDDIRFYSKSKLRTECPYAYKNDDNSSLAMMRGSALHLAIAIYLEYGKLTEKELFIICDESGLPEMFYDEVVCLFHQWKLNMGDWILASKETVCIESNDSNNFRYGKRITRVPLDENYGLHAIFDYVCIDKKTGRFEIIDWKTGQKPDEFENIMNGVIAYLYYGLDNINSIVYSVAQNSYSSLMVSKQNFDDLLDIIKKRIAIAREFEESGEYPRHVNKWCAYCSLKRDCEEYAKLLSNIPSFFSPTSTPEIVGQLDKLGIFRKSSDAEYKSLDVILKETLTDNEQTIGDYTYSVDERIRYEYPAEPVYNSLINLGYEDKIDGMLRISKKDLDALLAQIKANEGMQRYKEVREVVYSLKKEKSRSTTIKKRLIK